MKINREKIAALLAFLVMLFSISALVSSQIGLVRRHKEIPTKLNASPQSVMEVEPRLHLEDSGGSRNPFHFSTEWQPLTPEPLELPALEMERRPRVFFGWPADRTVGASIPYQTAIPQEKAAEEGEESAPAPSEGATNPPAGPSDLKGGRK
ncbi:MAG: hypothetical protein HY717_14600 [Planctomycetes bacterium]|nr:hypothetical protein [Planctomycetota bacterium]